MKSATCEASNNIVTIYSSTHDRNAAAVVMQINFAKLKSEINASQRINASQKINASQRINASLRINASQTINASQRINA